MTSPRPHTERWAYRWLYTAPVFALAARLYPLARRLGFRFVSRSVAAFYSYTQPQVLKTVHSNICRLDPKLPPRAAHCVFQNFATIIADYTALFSMPEKQASKLCAGFEGREHLEVAAAQGGLLATGHFGFFEFGAVVLQQLNIPLTIATLPEPSPALSAWRAQWRRRWQAETVEIRADPFASLEIRHAIEQKRLVAVLADRPHPAHALPVPLAHASIPFSTTPALLSLSTGRPIVPTVIFLEGHHLYHIRALPPLWPPQNQADKRAAIRELTTALGTALGQQFSQHPTQWFQFAPLPSAS